MKNFDVCSQFAGRFRQRRYLELQPCAKLNLLKLITGPVAADAAEDVVGLKHGLEGRMRMVGEWRMDSRLLSLHR